MHILTPSYWHLNHPLFHLHSCRLPTIAWMNATSSTPSISSFTTTALLGKMMSLSICWNLINTISDMNGGFLLYSTFFHINISLNYLVADSAHHKSTSRWKPKGRKWHSMRPCRQRYGGSSSQTPSLVRQEALLCSLYTFLVVLCTFIRAYVSKSTSTFFSDDTCAKILSPSLFSSHRLSRSFRRLWSLK